MAARHQNTYFLILTTQVLLILLLSTTCLSAECRTSGRYGDNCEHRCSGYCQTAYSCDSVSGACNGGCGAEHYGENCTQTCSATCKTPYTCDSVSGACSGGCKVEYYGVKCEDRCSYNCKTAYTCDSASGACSGGCYGQYYGEKCEDPCSSNCKTASCDSGSGACSGGCKAAYYGEKCEDRCSANCKTATCDSVSGACSGGCRADYYGVKCEDRCSANCKTAYNCDSVSGACDGGCKEWYMPDNCALLIGGVSLHDETKPTIADVKDHSVEILWHQDSNVAPGTEAHVGYYIRYLESQYDINDETHRKETDPVAHDPSVQSHATLIVGLTKSTEYHFKVRVFRVWPSTAPGPKEEREETYPTAIFYFTTTAGSVTSSPTSPSTVRTQPPTTPPTVRTQPPTTPPTVRTQPPTTPPTVRTQPPTTPPTVRTKAPTPAPATPAQTSPTTAAPTLASGKPVVGTSSEDVGVIVGAVLGAIAIMVLVIIAVLLLLRHRGLIAGFPACLRREKNSKLSTEDIVVHHPTAKPFVAVKPIIPNGHHNRAFSDDVDHGSDTSALESTPVALLPPVTADRTSVAVEDLQTYVDNKKHSPQDMVTEYGKLPKEDHKKCKAAEKPENKPKNRFVNIHAYEQSRVMLEKIDGDPLSDYINANYVKGYKDKEKAYIATQGPKPNTIPDLWRMVWEKKANRIVMVTRLVENNRIKSEVYWPLKNGSSERYGDITVTMEGMETYTDYCIRILGVECEGEMRLVRQFHFSSWPDKQKPEHAFHLLAFRRKINSFSKAKTGPMIVHCSAGVGRTGTYIGIDYLLEQAEAEGKVDIFTHVSYMRRERMNMVQTRDQYVFVHEALVEALKSGDTSMPCSDFEADFARICREPKEKPEIERQFEVLCELKTPVLTEKMTGMNSKNKAKNRSLDTVPDDRLRPYLTTRYKEGTDYINATYLESFKAHGAYLATQAPLPSTIVDFWRLIHDHNCRTIIMLNELDEEDEECPIYWPTKDEPDQTYGPLHVKLVKEEAVDGSPFIARDLRLSLADSKSSGDEDDEDSKDKGSDQGSLIRQYQVTKWSKDEDVPANPSVLLDLLDHQQKWQQSLPAIGLSRTAVHCLNGASRSGLFCTASFMLDKMKVDQEVDVFLAARYITCRRDGAIHTQEQYTFLHQLANACMSRFQTYANFQ